MRFKGLDLNLLVALDVLLETRSVTRAAERLNLSQPAMSSALNRLRNYLGDDILVVDGKRMYPSAYAAGLVPQLRDCLRTIDAMVSSSTSFDPATSQRTFTVACSDYVVQTIVAPLMARLAGTAPGLRIDIVNPSDDTIRHMEEGKIDVWITPDSFQDPSYPAETLYEERFVVVGWDQHPIFQGPFDEAELFAHGHVVVSFGPGRTASFADRQLQSLGKARRVEAHAASFTTVPWILKDTLRLAFMHERLAKAMASYFPMALAPIPFDFPRMRQIIQHHPAREGDEGLTWLRAQLREVTDTYAAETAP